MKRQPAETARRLSDYTLRSKKTDLHTVEALAPSENDTKEQ
jgi:hypothetical protein